MAGRGCRGRSRPSAAALAYELAQRPADLIIAAEVAKSSRRNTSPRLRAMRFSSRCFQALRFGGTRFSYLTTYDTCMEVSIKKSMHYQSPFMTGGWLRPRFGSLRSIPPAKFRKIQEFQKGAGCCRSALLVWNCSEAAARSASGPIKPLSEICIQISDKCQPSSNFCRCLEAQNNLIHKGEITFRGVVLPSWCRCASAGQIIDSSMNFTRVGGTSADLR